MEQTGKTLSMHSGSIYKGDVSHNGTLLKLHENAYTIGYSNLFAPDGETAGVAKFGQGLFFDAALDNNQAFVGAPTGDDAEPVFAGVMVREPAIASGYPAINDEVTSFQKGLICREGYVIYKKGLYGTETTEAELFSNVHYGDKVVVNNATGKLVFGVASAGVGQTDVGRIVEVNPDDKSVTLYISPKYYLG